jgi:N-glycosylase/DNA lyase
VDVALCVSSGQVFRWQKLPDGRWFGVDGESWFLVPSSGRPEDLLGDQTAFLRLFRLDEDLDKVQAEIGRLGPELIPYMEALPGLRLMRPSSAEETFFSFLCTPNNNVSRITGMVRTLAAYGEPMQVPAHLPPSHHFPSTERIASIPEEELRHRRFGYRAGTITRAAAWLLGRGPGWLESLRSASYEAAFGELLEVPGVGPKLADCIALFALHHTEAVPIDTHIWQQIVRLYRPEWSDKTLTHVRYREAGALFRARFGLLAGWAQQYLFYDNLVNWRSRR